MSLGSVDILSRPDRPGQTCHLARHGYGGSVVSSSLGEGKAPALEAIERKTLGAATCGGQENRSRPVCEESSKVRVATFGDRSEPSFLAARVLARHEANEGRHTPSGTKARRLADVRDERRGRQKPYARDRLDPIDVRDSLGEDLQLLLSRTDALVDVPQLGENRRQKGRDGRGDSLACEECQDPWRHVGRSDGCR